MEGCLEGGEYSNLVFYLRPDYSKLIEYRSKQSMEIKIFRRFVSGSFLPFPTIFLRCGIVGIVDNWLKKVVLQIL